MILHSAAARTTLRHKKRWNMKRNWPLHVMLLVPLALLLVFSYLPMFGIIIAFQDFKPWLGFARSPWVGWEHFETLLIYPDGQQVIINTVIIAIAKLITKFITPFLFAIFLNEVRQKTYKKLVQTCVYLPHFLSWVVLGSIFLDVFSYNGIVNHALGLLGIDPIMFMAKGNWARFVLVLTDTWQDFGYGVIVYLAAITGADPALYEAAQIDGANRFRQCLAVTIPAMMPIAVVIGTMSLGKVLNAGFDQIFNMYNPLIYSHVDVIDTFVYRTGLINGKFGFSTAVGLFRSVISLVLTLISYRLAYRFADYRIF